MLIVLLIGLGGCSNYSEYTKALERVSYNNLMAANAHLRWLYEQEKKTSKEEKEYKRDMLQMYSNSMVAASSTPEKTDDVLVPVVFSLMAFTDKIAKPQTGVSIQAPPTQKVDIVPPETPGQFAQRAGSTILGLAGITVQVVDSHNDRKVMEALAAGSGVRIDAKDNARVAYDSFKSGSDNTINGDGTINGGSISGSMQSESAEEGSETPEITDPENGCFGTPPSSCGSAPVCIDGQWKYNQSCSCPSHEQGRC
jgi:hypothetical protein